MIVENFMPHVELTKAIKLIANDASNTSHSVSDADALVKQNFANDDSCQGGGFFVTYFKKPGVKIEGLRSAPFNGGTMLSSFCTPDRVKKLYQAAKYCKTARMGVTIYTTPAHMEILSEQI